MTYYYYHNEGQMPRVFIFAGNKGRAYFFKECSLYLCSSVWSTKEMAALKAPRISRDEARGIIGRKQFNLVRAAVKESFIDSDFTGIDFKEYNYGHN